MTLIERVAAERCDKIGGSVGYAVRGETKVNTYTRMMRVLLVVVAAVTRMLAQQHTAQPEPFDLEGRESQQSSLSNVFCRRHQKHNSNLLLPVSCYVDCTAILN